MNFNTLGLSEAMQQVIVNAGYSVPTPIQAEAIPKILAGGDLIASAQTGTGKTAAFALPILQKLSQKNYSKVRPIRALILTPTRELASQVGATFKSLGSGLNPKIRTIEVFGGVRIEAQEHKLKLGCDVLVATPGRLIDLIGQGIVKLNQVQIFVLDEGDRLLEMGFQPAIKEISAKIPPNSQRLMFSATFSNDVDLMAAFILKRPERLAPQTDTVVVPKIRQIVHCVQSSAKTMALRAILEKYDDRQVLVFVNTRVQAADLSRDLGFAGLNAGCLHGELDQRARIKVLGTFMDGSLRVLIATDVAARGLHIPDLPLVINYEIPSNTDDYVHRIGRTGRSGQTGIAISLASPGEMESVGYIEELIGEKIERQKIAGFKANTETHRKRKEEIEIPKAKKTREGRFKKPEVFNPKSAKLRGKDSKKGSVKESKFRGKDSKKSHGRDSQKSRGKTAVKSKIRR